MSGGGRPLRRRGAPQRLEGPGGDLQEDEGLKDIREAYHPHSNRDITRPADMGRSIEVARSIEDFRLP